MFFFHVFIYIKNMIFKFINYLNLIHLNIFFKILKKQSSMKRLYIFSFILCLLTIVLSKKKKKKKISSKGIHEFEMFVDLLSLEKNRKLSSKSRYKIKKALNATQDILSQILLSNNSKKITVQTNITRVCKQEIPYYNSSIHEGINTDFILYPIFSKRQKILVKHGLCMSYVKSLRPTIGYLKIGKPSNFSNYTSEDLTIIFLHHITHILGFTSKRMQKFTKNKDLKSYIIFDDEVGDISFKGSKLLNELFINKEYEYINIETNDNELHWSDDIPFPDYMKENERNNLITPYSLSLFDNLGYFIVQLPYLIYDSKTSSYNIRSYSIFNNALVEIGQCYGDTFKLYIKKGNKCENSKRENENYITLLKFPELNKIEKQNLTVISPSPICINKQKTIYFKYLPVVNKTQIPEYPLSNMIITLKEYMIVSLEKFGSGPSSPGCLRRNMENTNITKVIFLQEANSLWFNSGSNVIRPNFIPKYSKYNHFFKHGQITRKDLLYSNYFKLKEKFPNDFTYMAETYDFPNDKELIEDKFFDYSPTEDNLWLLKPKGAARGNGIKFLKSYSDITKGNIITRYISNPHLIDGRKYDCRVYLFVTSHRPLKIYVYNEGLARRATDPFNLDINNLDNFFIHLTNVAVNKKNRKFVEGDENSEQRSIWSLTMLKEQLKKEGKDFELVFQQIKDIAIKAIISMTSKEIEDEKSKRNYNLNSQNLFELYGMDILLDQNMKPWLLEINLSPSLASIGKFEERLKLQLFADMYNIIGLKSYSHYDFEPYEDSPDYENKIDEDINESICEFTRPMGGFIRVFPRKDNIDYYKQFFKDPVEENLVLWDEIQKLDI